MIEAFAQDTRQAEIDAVRAHYVLRFAFCLTLAFVASELLQWTPTFLAPALVGAILTSVPVRPPLKIAVGLLLIVAISALVAVVLSNALLRSPMVLFGVAALVAFRGLYAIAAGTPRLAPMMLLICVTTIPVVALDTPWVAEAFGFALVRATALAILVVWISYLLWPRVSPPKPAAQDVPLPPDVRLRIALLGTCVLAPLMLVHLMFGLTDALPVLVATTMIMVNLDFARGRMQALALVAGNVAGGIVALLLYLLLAVESSLLSFTLLTLLTGLAFGWRISKGDPLAAVFVVACNATLIVFSSSLMSDQGTVSVWITRLSQFVVAGAFTIGMMTLMWPVKKPVAAQALPPPTS